MQIYEGDTASCNINSHNGKTLGVNANILAMKKYFIDFIAHIPEVGGYAWGSSGEFEGGPLVGILENEYEWGPVWENWNME